MTRASEKRRRQAFVAAALTVAFVALFAVAFLGVVVMLDDYADSLDAQEEEETVVPDIAAPTDPFYVLLIGSDSRKGTALYTGNAREHAQLDQHSDVMTLMRVDPLSLTITLVTIPRDTVLEGGTSKINESLQTNDPALVVDAVAELTGVRADYYMMTTFISFENLVNALGGIDVDVPETVTVVDPATGKSVTVKAGKDRHLDGSEALVLTRSRKEYDGNQDALRQVNVRNIERAMIERVLDLDSGLDVGHVLAAIEDDTKTDLDLPSMGPLMQKFVEFADEVTIYDCTGPYSGDNRPGDGAWVVEEDEAAWEKLMAAVDAGADPSGVIKAPKF